MGLKAERNGMVLVGAAIIATVKAPGLSAGSFAVRGHADRAKKTRHCLRFFASGDIDISSVLQSFQLVKRSRRTCAATTYLWGLVAKATT